MSQIILSKSSKKDKKWMVKLPTGKTVHFGARGYQDYTQHKDPERKRLYIIRHQKREKWAKNGIATAGFWSRWLLWNQPSLLSSIRSTANKFKLTIKKRYQTTTNSPMEITFHSKETNSFQVLVDGQQVKVETQPQTIVSGNTTITVQNGIETIPTGSVVKMVFK